MSRDSIRLLYVLVAAALCATPAAYAHNLQIVATAEGRTISGYAYFAGHGRGPELPVTILGPAGETLHELTTDHEGEFRFEANRRCDHRIVVDIGDGHAAEWTVMAGELPANLPEDATAPPQTPLVERPSFPAAEKFRAEFDAALKEDLDTLSARMTGVVPTPSRSMLRETVDDSVTTHLAPLQAQLNALRKQLDGYEQQVRLRDILGGIGYIIGLAGMALYFSKRRGRV